MSISVSLSQNVVLEQVDPRSLRPHPRNLAIYGDETIDDLKQEIIKSKWIKHLVVDQNNVIIAGHRRRRVALELNLATVPVERRVFASELEERKALLLENVYREKTVVQKVREAEEWEGIYGEEAKLIQKIQGDKGKEGGRPIGGKTVDISIDTGLSIDTQKTLQDTCPEGFSEKKSVQTVPSQGLQSRQEHHTISTPLTSSPQWNVEEKKASAPQSRDKIASQVGLGSGKTYERAKTVVQEVDTLRKQGKVEEAKVLETLVNQPKSVSVAAQVAAMPEPKKLAVLETLATGKAKDVKEAKTFVHRAELAEQAKSVVLPQNMKVLHGDFRAMINQFSDSSVDMIFTDPPYHQEHLQLWTDLSEFAFRVLKPGGILLAYSGQIFLPDVLIRLSQHLDYCWLLGVQHTGGHIQIWKHQLWNDWKPIVMFSKGKAADHEWFMDLYRSDQGKGDKLAHDWSQGEREASYFIEKLTRPGSLVVDPMCGSGTILRAAHKLKRWSAGIEIDEQRYKIAYSSMKELMEVVR